MDRPDAIVVGSGPNGLVAANHLADAGWSVLVLEAALQPGGAVRSAEVTEPGFVNDLFSAFYPLAACSPALTTLRLEEHGLRWTRAPAVTAHPMPGGPAAVIHRDRARTAAALDAMARGDGAAWLRFVDEWERTGRQLLDALLDPFPPVRATGRLLWRTRSPRALAEVARTALTTVRALAGERFAGDGPAAMLAGLALHADLGPDSPTSGLFGWILGGLAQTVGFPVPVGGAGALTAALVARLEAKGGEVRCGTTVARVLDRHGEARGVVTTAGVEIPATRAVLADVSLPALYGQLVAPAHVDPAARRDLERFDPGLGTVKVDWALGAPIPWTDPCVRDAGTVHLGGTLDEQSISAALLAAGRVPEHPLVIVGQMTTTDATRSPAGTESAWAYTHVPSNHPGHRWTVDDTAEVVARVEASIERLAPGFTARILARHVAGPADLEAADANLIGGAIGGGTSLLHQQAIWRPSRSWGRPETPLRGLYLASASAHPGGGVHGAPGRNAARAALARARWRPRRTR